MLTLIQMLGRFATNMSFSVDSKGGGRESNSRLLPFMIQMARHLLDQGGASQRRIQAKSLNTYLSPSTTSESVEGGKPSTPTTPQRGSSSEESVQFMMVQSLLLQSLDEWQRFRRTFIQRGLAHAYTQYKQGRSLLPASPLPSPLPDSSPIVLEPKTPDTSSQDKNGALSSEQLFTISHPMLVYVGLVDQLQHFFKSGMVKAVGQREVEVDAAAESTKETEAAPASQIGIEPWEVSMKDRVRDVGAMLGFCKEMLEWLEDMQDAGDVQEALDIMGALSDALTGGCTSCDDFVREAIAGR